MTRWLPQAKEAVAVRLSASRELGAPWSAPIINRERASRSWIRGAGDARSLSRRGLTLVETQERTVPIRVSLRSMDASALDRFASKIEAPIGDVGSDTR